MMRVKDHVDVVGHYRPCKKGVTLAIEKTQHFQPPSLQFQDSRSGRHRRRHQGRFGSFHRVVLGGVSFRLLNSRPICSAVLTKSFASNWYESITAWGSKSPRRKVTE